MKKKILKEAGVLLVVAVLVFSSAVMIARTSDNPLKGAEGDILNIDFYQMDFNFDGEITTNSDWGVIDLTFIGSLDILYLNLVTDDEWTIQNLPVLTLQDIDEDQIQHFWFPLGVPSGIQVTEITYGAELTSTILIDPPADVQSADVESDGYEVYNSGDSDLFPEEPATAAPVKGGAAAEPEQHRHEGFPNQQAGRYECAPTAVSNSLQFLNEKFELGLDASEIDIETMKAACGFVENWGCPRDTWWELKDAFMKLFGYPITTRKFTRNQIGQIAGEIDKGQDVEMELYGHTVAIVGIVDLGNGNYSVTISHDKNQSNPNGGTVTETGTYNSNSGKWSGPLASYEGINYFVVECPDLPEWKFHFKYDNCPGGFLQIFGTIDCERQIPPIWEGYAKRCKVYEGYVPNTVNGETINDIIFDFFWDWWCNNEDHIKFATPTWNGELEQWELEPISPWIDVNVEEYVLIPTIGDPSGEIQEVHYMVNLAEFLEDPRPPQDEYYIYDGCCEDLPGYLIGTTPIVFDPNAGPDESPFSTQPLTGLLYSDGEIILGPSENFAPLAPDIDGQIGGKAGTEYEYTFNTVDPDGDDIKYFIDWGDGNTEWTDFSASGTPVTVNHTWAEKDTYTITAKAQDEYGLEGPEGTLEVSMPMNQPSQQSTNTLFVQFLQRLIQQFPVLGQMLSLSPLYNRILNIQ